MGRKPCCEKAGLKRGPWTIEEDNKLVNFIINNGIQCWRNVPDLAGLLRCGKSCRLRWINYLRPDLKRGAFTEAEDNKIIELHGLLGNRWSKIASHFPGRTDNEIKNHWNTRIKKMLKLRGIDPLTHKPKGESMKLHDEQEEALSSCKRETSMTNDCNNSPSFKQEDSSAAYCPSSSLEESNLNAYVHEEDSDMLQWVDNLDSLLSWDVINQLDDNFVSSESTQHTAVI